MPLASLAPDSWAAPGLAVILRRDVQGHRAWINLVVAEWAVRRRSAPRRLERDATIILTLGASRY
jgi:hypothetical protein